MSSEVTKDSFLSMSNEEKWELFKQSQSVNLKLDTVIDKIEKLESQLVFSRNVNDRLKNEIVNIKRKANRNCQYERQDNIEFSGIPDSIPDDNLEDVAIQLMKKMDINVETRDIVDCHRLPKRKSVILRFVNRKNALKALSNGKKLKNNVGDILPGNPAVFVNRNLIPEYLSLRWKAKQLKQANYLHEFGLNRRGVWVKVGTESSKKQVEVEEDLHEFLPAGRSFQDFLNNLHD